MTLLTVVYDAAVERSVMGLLEELQVQAWTKIYHVEGEGQAGLKLNTPVWPGINNILYLAGERDAMCSVASGIRELQSEFKLRPGIYMYMQEVTEV